MSDLWEKTETLRDTLHRLAGLEDALHQVLDEPLAAQPDKGHAAYALIQSMAQCREDAAAIAKDLRAA